MNSRPLSPHLQIYRLTMTMMMSIGHRISGMALYAVMLGLILWFVLLAFYPALFNQAQALAASFEGRVILFLACWSFTHHFFGGLRHFIWDTGRGFGPYGREWLSWGSFICGLFSSAAIVWGPDHQQIIEAWL